MSFVIILLARRVCSLRFLVSESMSSAIFSCMEWWYFMRASRSSPVDDCLAALWRTPSAVRKFTIPGYICMEKD